MMVLAACGENEKDDTTKKAEDEEVKSLNVDFEVPETVDPGDPVELKATVTYGDEKVTDAEEVVFEIWEKDKKDDSIKVESTNNQDGTYTAETTFDHDGEYEMYAHTTARALHTMPKKAIIVGDGKSHEEQEAENHEHDSGEHDHGTHAEGFSMHFNKLENVKIDQDVEMTVHLQMDEQALEQAAVRYEVWKEGEEKHEWVDAEEKKAGEYTANHSFGEQGTYHAIIHVENDEGLHEHEEYQIEVAK